LDPRERVAKNGTPTNQKDVAPLLREIANLFHDDRAKQRLILQLAEP
jgi:hypothetical protein